MRRRRKRRRIREEEENEGKVVSGEDVYGNERKWEE